VNRIFKWVALLFVCVASLFYGLSFVWPAYNWELRLPSPDGRYDLVVLRGDAAAFDDFSYRIYIFPHSLVPKDRAKSDRVLLTPIWRGCKYLVYSGYNYPELRWTGPRSVEIDVNDLYPEPFAVDPVKTFGKSDGAVLVSIAFGKVSGTNSQP